MGLYHRSQAFSTTLGPQVSKQFSFSLAPLYYIMFYLVLILPYIVLDCSERITDLNIQKKHNSKLTLFISEHKERERKKKKQSFTTLTSNKQYTSYKITNRAGQSHCSLFVDTLRFSFLWVLILFKDCFLPIIFLHFPFISSYYQQYIVLKCVILYFP